MESLLDDRYEYVQIVHSGYIQFKISQPLESKSKPKLKLKFDSSGMVGSGSDDVEQQG